MWSASRLTASTFGVLAGIGGFTHGIGEVRQGNVSIHGLVFDSWVHDPIATNLGGEPAVTVVPTMVATAVLSISVSVAVVVWTVAFLQRRNGDLVLLGLLVLMLLGGGGIAPPIFGLIGATAALGMHRSLGWWRTRLPTGAQRVLARMWPGAYAVCTAIGMFLVIGSVALVYLFDLNRPELFANTFLVLVPALIVTVLAAFARDAQHDATEPRRTHPLAAHGLS